MKSDSFNRHGCRLTVQDGQRRWFGKERGVASTSEDREKRMACLVFCLRQMSKSLLRRPPRYVCKTGQRHKDEDDKLEEKESKDRDTTAIAKGKWNYRS